MTTWRSSYAAGHDLAEPLRSISGFADLLRMRYRGRLDHDADESIDFVTSGAARMQQLINDLLAYGRLTTRTQLMATVDVQQVLDSVLADLNGRISESGAAVHIDRLPVLNADQTELAQVFANVMRNALTSSPPTPHRRCRRLPD